MNKYRIRESVGAALVTAEVWRWWCPVWLELKTYHTLYGSRENAIRWCREAIDKHRAGKPLEEPEWKEIK